MLLLLTMLVLLLLLLLAVPLIVRQISAKNRFRCSKNLTKAIDRGHRQLFKTPNGFKIEAIAKKLH